MNQTKLSTGIRWNTKLDLAAWILVGGIILVPLAIKGAGFVAPSFLSFLPLIAIAGLGAWVFLILDKVKKRTETSGMAEIFLQMTAKLVGGLFIVSGFVKLQDILGFSYKLDEYWNVFGTEFMLPTSLFMAWFVSVFEVALAIALMTGFKMRISSFLTLGMIVFFTFLTGYSAITGKVTDCGCFGDALKLTPWESFEKDILLTFAIVPLFISSKRLKELCPGFVSGTLSLGSFVFFGIFSYWTYQHLPVMDFRTAYKAGQDLDYNWQHVNHENEIIAHDFMPLGMSCDTNEFLGNTLYIIMYDLGKADKEGIKASVELAKELEGSGILVIGGTSSLSDMREQVVKEYGLPYCLAPTDQTVLKTMIRSNPGYILMKKGIIQKKWHHNDTPTKQELFEALK